MSQVDAGLEAPSDEALMREARSWISETAPAYTSEKAEHSLFPHLTDEQHVESVARARAWERAKAEAGWAGLNVPVELGGRGRGVSLALRFDDLEHEYQLPHHVFVVTRGMVLPTLMAWGTADQQQQFVPRMLTGESLWCQLFSEPGTGSDLAAVTTQAQRTADGWAISGQKVWTSYGPEADYGYLLARSDSDAGKHGGLTTFLVDMRSPGIETRHIRQATGATTFGEVFFDNVVLPPDSVLGSAGEGWKVVNTTLMNERLSLNAGGIPVEALVALVRERGLLGDAHARQALIRLYSRRVVAGLVRERMLAELDAGATPGPEGSMAKIYLSRGVEEAGELATYCLGADALLEDEWSDLALGAFGLAIGGGTEEILKSMLAERVLGMPREARV